MAELGLKSRLAAEAVAIVGSILLAFAIDAAWSGYQDRRQEAEVRELLRIEFADARRQLAELRAEHEEIRGAALRLLTMTGPRAEVVVDAAVLDSLLGDITDAYTFDPRQGTLASLLSSGDIGLIQDRELQSHLAAWPYVVADVREEQVRSWDDAWERLVPLIARYVFHRGSARGPSRFESDYQGLLRSREFEALVDDRRVAAQDVLGELDEAEGMLDALLEAL